MSRTRWWILGTTIALVLLKQVSVVFFTPWQSDYRHWFGAAFIPAICALPLSFAYRRWRDGPVGYRKFQKSVAAALADKTPLKKYRVIEIVIVIILTVIFYLRPPH